jgi:hypothetical protein
MLNKSADQTSARDIMEKAEQAIPTERPKESPQGRDKVSCAALIASLAESRSAETISGRHVFRQRCKRKILQP